MPGSLFSAPGTKAAAPCNIESKPDFRGKSVLPRCNGTWEYRCLLWQWLQRGTAILNFTPQLTCSDRNGYRGFPVGEWVEIPGRWEKGKWRGCLNLGPIRQHSMARLGSEVWILERNGKEAHSHLQQSACPVLGSLLLPTSDGNIHLLQPCCRSPDRGYSGHCCWTQLTTSELAQRKEPHCTGMCSYRKSWHLAAWNILHLVNLYFSFCRVLKPSVFPQGPWWNEHHHMPRSVEQGSTCNRSSNQATGTTQPAQAKELMPGWKPRCNFAAASSQV